MDIAAIPALTVQQPWAWAIVSGLKQVENRTWSTGYRGPLLIHAGKGTAWLRALGDLLPEMPPDLSFGAIVGGAELVDVVPPEDVAAGQRRFASGPCCWVLTGAWMLPAPLPCGGRLGLWSPPADLVRAAYASRSAAASGSGGPTNS